MKELLSLIKNLLSKGGVQRATPQAQTALIKYIFFDIVGFTKNRSVEAQADLIGCLNSVVRDALKKNNLSGKQTIFIPTGDGICIALIDVGGEYDIHLQVALDILYLTCTHNSKTEDEMRKFEVRIGLNENVDNLVTDINGNQNVAGMGINMAQRAMSQADGSQILVAQATHETLCGREKYMKSFRQYTAKGKHGIAFPVYQYIEQRKKYLNLEVPKNFTQVKKVEPKLTRLVAYYLAHALKYQRFFLSKTRDSLLNYNAPILLYLLANDSQYQSKRTKYDQSSSYAFVWGSSRRASTEEQYNHYAESDNWGNIQFANLLQEVHLSKFASCFEGKINSPRYAFVSEKGRAKLKQEWPDIWEEFSLEELE